MADDTWRHGAAYLYVLALPRARRTWEFLRRNDDYCNAYRAGDGRPEGSIAGQPAPVNAASHWGLHCLA